MSLSPRSNNVFQRVIVFVLVTIIFYYLFFEGRFDAHVVYRVAITGKKVAFVEDFLGTEIDGPFDGSALADMCNTKTWIPGLIFKCEAPRAGIASVRNIFLNCVRYAIEAGGVLKPLTSELPLTWLFQQLASSSQKSWSAAQKPIVSMNYTPSASYLSPTSSIKRTSTLRSVPPVPESTSTPTKTTSGTNPPRLRQSGSCTHNSRPTSTRKPRP